MQPFNITTLTQFYYATAEIKLHHELSAYQLTTLLNDQYK
jgi:hypothetical protein